MPLVIPRKTIEKFSQFHDLDEYKKAVFAQIDLDNFEVILNRVLCAVYLSNEKTRGGIILPTDQKAEDIWQGKPALVLKLGPTAFVDSSGYSFAGQMLAVGDWVTFKIGNADQIELNEYPCRVVSDSWIYGKVADPRMVTS